mgnify:CR=1 FL=1
MLTLLGFKFANKIMIDKQFKIIQEEVQDIHKKIVELSIHNSEIKNLYKGCQILFSPLFVCPKVLLIGFNPGAGFYNSEKRIVENFEAMSKLEYYLSEHSLANQTKKLFFEMGNESILQEETLKINFYFFATSNVSDFKKLIKLLPETLKKELFHQARIWTKKLIDIINPEIILCEGAGSFAEVSALYFNKINLDENTFYRQFITEDNKVVFGYYRNQGSILNKIEVANVLKKLI